ncbi:hypothetical protein AciX9_4357 (plasmid) [Granulicella tundricola MP5ACTX9]|uniref:Uncharacterized protein n=1 Tax=Granulicella tundricola (strain ATCC BAA-1859 / DSM 23138 / MP5ACTX9) TaxID=1198114 RepID=E8X775_GRATM|nr:hypothetical protein AciX9_4357 [Granulicella tundricola MP5ACTX9]
MHLLHPYRNSVWKANDHNWRVCVDSLNKCLNCIAQPRLYSSEQTIALVFGLVCLGVDAWAVYCTVQYFNRGRVELGPGDHTFGLASLFLEPMLAISILFLLGFAFSSRAHGKEHG